MLKTSFLSTKGIVTETYFWIFFTNSHKKRVDLLYRLYLKGPTYKYIYVLNSFFNYTPLA